MHVIKQIKYMYNIITYPKITPTVLVKKNVETKEKKLITKIDEK